MARHKAQVLKLMRLIDEYMVDAQLVEVGHVILSVLQIILQLGELRSQVRFAFLQSALHLFRNLIASVAIVTHSLQRVLHLLQHRVGDVSLNLQRLRNPAKLVVTHDDAVPVARLHAVKEIHTVSGTVVCLGSKQHLCLRVARSVRLCDGAHIRLQSDNHRLVAHSQSLHLVGSDTHDHRLAAAYLMVTNTTAVQQQHPDTILLRLV